MPKLLFARAPVDEVEERKVRKLAGARHAPADWMRRSQIIELSWAGLRVPAIAQKLGCAAKTVRYRLERFNAEGVDGFADRPGVGRKRRITEAQRSQIVALVATPPPGRLMRTAGGDLAATDETGPGVWTLNALTQAAREHGIDIARSQVRRILRDEGVRWRQPRSWAGSTDPEFVPKGQRLSSATRNRRKIRQSSAVTSSAR
jgi:transposase